MKAPPDEPFPMPEIDWRGVDLSQIRQMLELTPLQRIEWLDALMEGIYELQALNGQTKAR